MLSVLIFLPLIGLLLIWGSPARFARTINVLTCGVALVVNVDEGLTGVAKGTTKWIRVMEDIPKPHGAERSGGSWWRSRICSGGGVMREIFQESL